jgi:hypothetical protein
MVDVFILALMGCQPAPHEDPIFHENSRAEGPGQQTTKTDRLSHVAVACAPSALLRGPLNRWDDKIVLDLRTICRRLCYAAAPLAGMLVYWRIPFLWFVNDDFAWLGLPAEARAHGLLYALFTPFAQGTVRVFSERLFFLAFSGLFGLHAWPYHLWALATWMLAVTLVQRIGERLTQSRAAGLLAALVWAANVNVAPPVAWASAYNQILCGALLLAAFYSRLRGWRVAEWVFYLAGFGALEVTVMYPFLAALHAFCADGKRLRGTAWLFVPAGLFAALHFLFIPKPPDSVYALAVDHRLAVTVKTYLSWTLEPGSAALGPNIEAYRTPERILGLLFALALAGFVVRSLMRKQWLGVFFCGWFLLLLAPVLPLPEHLMFYYLTLPSIGLAWLAGWAIASGYHAGRGPRVLAIALAAIYFTASVAGVEAEVRSYAVRGQRMRTVMEGVAAVVAAHPGNAVALEGADTQLVNSGFGDRPFRLVGAPQVWLLADDAEALPAQVVSGRVRVLNVTGGETHDVTEAYIKTFADQRRNYVDVGNPAYATRLGPTWYPIENGYRWAPRFATLRIAGPSSRDGKLHVTGYAPAPVLAGGPATLVFRVGSVILGRATISKPGGDFSLDIPLPPQPAGQETVEISIETQSKFHPVGDGRDLGMVFGTFTVQ